MRFRSLMCKYMKVYERGIITWMRYISRQTDLEVDNEADGGVDEGIKVDPKMR